MRFIRSSLGLAALFVLFYHSAEAYTYKDTAAEGNILTTTKEEDSYRAYQKDIIGYDVRADARYDLETVTPCKESGEVNYDADFSSLGACPQAILCEQGNVTKSVTDGRYISYFRYNQRHDCEDYTYERTTYPYTVECERGDDYGDPYDGIDPEPETCPDYSRPEVTQEPRSRIKILSLQDNPNANIELKIYDTQTGTSASLDNLADLDISMTMSGSAGVNGVTDLSGIKTYAYKDTVCWSRDRNEDMRCYDIRTGVFKNAPGTSQIVTQYGFTPQISAKATAFVNSDGSSIVLDSAILSGAGIRFSPIYSPAPSPNPDTTVSLLRNDFGMIMAASGAKYSFIEREYTVTTTTELVDDPYSTDPADLIEQPRTTRSTVYNLKYLDQGTGASANVFDGFSSNSKFDLVSNSARNQFNVYFIESGAVAHTVSLYQWNAQTQTVTTLVPSFPVSSPQFFEVSGNKVVYSASGGGGAYPTTTSFDVLDLRSGTTTRILQ